MIVETAKSKTIGVGDTADQNMPLFLTLLNSKDDHLGKLTTVVGTAKSEFTSWTPLSQ
jgi:hypothetical protein